MPSSKIPRVAALGYYGFGNLGDEAVLAGIRQALAEKAGETDFLSLSNRPEETTKLHPGTRAVNRWQWRDVAAALRGTDLFILGGGSLLQDATSVKSVVWYALMALLARRRAKQILWWGQGIGPLTAPLTQRLVKIVGNQADRITVRDENSAFLLKQIGVRGSIEVVADPAFALIPSLPDKSMVQSSPVLLLALRDWKQDVVGTKWKSGNGSQELGAVGGSGLVAVPMHLPDDLDYGRKVLGAMPMLDWQKDSLTPSQVMGEFSQVCLVVAMRLHALIFAVRCGVPFVALSYDPKVDALAQAAGQADALLAVEDFTVAALKTVVERVLASESERRRDLSDFAAAQKVRALRPAEIAAEWLR